MQNTFFSPNAFPEVQLSKTDATFDSQSTDSIDSDDHYKNLYQKKAEKKMKAKKATSKMRIDDSFALISKMQQKGIKN